MLTILNVAFPFAAVGPDPLGGAEQILSTIDARLVRDGQASIVLAVEGSRAAGHLVTIPAPAGAVGGMIDDAARVRAHDAYRRQLAHLLREHTIDIVHVHGGDFTAYLPETEVPVVATLHLPPSWYPDAALANPAVHRICVSRAQWRSLPDGVVVDAVIENGIALDRYQPGARKAGFVLALGRLCHEKGFDLALAAAHAAGVPLALAGALFPYEAHIQHVREAILPGLDADRRWIGPVTGHRKRALLAQARCLLVTSRVDETSSLVAMEALASGTPVVGFRRGALPELVEHGHTGWLVEDPAELPDAIHRASALSPAACREAACERASATRMTDRYLAWYRDHRRPARLRRPVCDASLLTTDDELAAIEDDWNALCDRCPDATPFQRPGWLLAWRRWFGAGGVPRVIALRRANRLVALVPLELRGATLGLIGEGVSDYLDAIVEPDLDPAMLTELVWRAARGATEVVLDALRPRSALLELELGGTLAASTASPVVDLASRHEPPRLAYELRRLDRSGGVRWETESGDRDRLLDSLFALHAARWAPRGERGVLDGPTLEGFHREAAGALHERGLLRLVGLHLNERLIGVLYGFADHGRFLFYLSGFAPDVASLSPGRQLIAHAIGRALDEGAIEFDFLRGTEAYKYEWGALDRPSSIYRARLEEDAHARDSLDHR